MWNYGSEPAFSRSNSYHDHDPHDDEEALRWAALERLPTYDRVRRGIFRNVVGECEEIDVCSLHVDVKKLVLDRLGNAVGEDVEGFFQRMRQRFDAVNLEFPKVEVRFENLNVETYIHTGSRALPTIPNFMFNMTEVSVFTSAWSVRVSYTGRLHLTNALLLHKAFLRQLGIFSGKRRKLTILNYISGIIKPSRLTLLLGPPSSGKTTLLLALAGRLGTDLQMSGRLTYNGHALKEFVPQRTSAYVSQQDWHVAEMTVRETLQFSGRCQGVGVKYDMLLELSRREKNAGVKPDEDLDIFMKALAFGGQETSLVVEYILKILGLETCADTLMGDEMLKGISGGQKKRVTTGELLVGAARVLFMDEISTGLDSSTTYQIIKYLRHSNRSLDGTTVISLLQPAPETYELFDDIILLSEGQIVYQGPRESVLDFFAFVGFRCPKRKNVADFLQEVTSKKDQEQYWSVHNCPYQYIPVAKFTEAFRSFHIGRSLSEQLSLPFDRQYNHPLALSTSTYGGKRAELLKTSFSWQLLLMKRNSFIYVFKLIQLLFVALITMTLFFRSKMHHDTIDDGGIYLGALYFGMVIILFNGFMEVPMLVAKLPVLYKHRDMHFYPCWVYTLPSWILSIPISLVESGIWVAVTYYVIGFDPQITRFLCQFLLYFLLDQASMALFRLMATLGRNMIVANTFGSFAMLVVMALGGFIISRDSIPKWWIWGYWVSPLMYAQNAVSVNEFLGNSWDKRDGPASNLSMGKALLKSRGLFAESYWYWIGVGALLGYTILFNILFTFFLTYLNPLGKGQAVVSKEEFQDRDRGSKEQRVVIQLREFLEHSGSFAAHVYLLSIGLVKNSKEQKGMVLPFQPLSMSFSNINYYVDMPLELKQQGVQEDRLQLLVNVSGSFRPGVLTALVGVSGAGKTTLMDVLAGRKTGGFIEGSIHISGYPKKQETFARISGYCEQNDVHSPCLTVRESLIYSASLRLPSHVDSETRKVFVDEVMELVELTSLSGALVGLPGVDGLSTEQRKRLTIAVELVANPSIVFMDEPTSGLDARAAAIVMRTVRNIVNTGRTIVCTIHQPSTDIFESFDELLFMKRGGQLIYAGLLGAKSQKLVKFFEGIEGVQKISSGHNPAAWMLEVTSSPEESRLGVDFAEVYQRSHLFQQNKQLIETLSKPSSDTKDLSFPAKYSKSFLDQFLASLWKQNLSYWRNPQYTAVRFFYTVIISCMFGTIAWRFGSKRETQQDIFNAMGSMYAAVLFLGVTNSSAVQPVVSVERFVSYRERAAGMYSALPFAFAQVAIEFPYVFVQSLIYSTMFYSMASFEWDLIKFSWYIFYMYFTVLYFTLFGMMMTAVTPNHNVAAIISAPFYTLWNLFSGFMIPPKRIPIWWRWYYWANPVAWSLNGLMTSQFGDVDTTVKLSDGVNSVEIRKLLRHLFGFRHDYLGIAGLMVVSFCAMFAVIFAYAIKSFNFQRRSHIYSTNYTIDLQNEVIYWRTYLCILEVTKLNCLSLHNCIVFDSMVDILGKFQEFDSAWSLLREQLDTDETPLIVSTHTFGVLIRGYSRAGMYIPAIEVFEFARNLDPVSVNISSLDLFEILMDALCKEGKVGIATKYCDKRRELESGWIPSGRVYDVLISGRFCSGKLVQVEKLWEEMRRENVVPNVVTYAILVKGYCRMGQVDRGIELVEEMKREGIKPNVIVYNPIVDALSEAGRFDEAFGMVERLLVSDSGPSISTYKSLVKGFCKAGDFVGASKALKMMIGRGFVPTPTTYNYFFRYFSKIGKVEEGINLYKKMIEFGHAPNRLTYTLLIKMLCDLEKMNLAVQISKEMKDRGYDMDLTTGNMLLHLLCKLHRFEEAWSGFLCKSGKKLDNQDFIHYFFDSKSGRLDLTEQSGVPFSEVCIPQLAWELSEISLQRLLHLTEGFELVCLQYLPSCQGLL
ncbi:hypothetical protein GIB67_030681 [Kingdonia uniflora]|uniref:ABC transporter domain-containing protein n=1 Tax=Kingdonia uniflora TaxID=39325 RepID=A0A7J7NJB4_9MAGN|nr:hypothetical protein GIB67_030681 [Kingdonia uniflora]